jgi:hypothetical protein
MKIRDGNVRIDVSGDSQLKIEVEAKGNGFNDQP